MGPDAEGGDERVVTGIGADRHRREPDGGRTTTKGLTPCGPTATLRCSAAETQGRRHGAADGEEKAMDLKPGTRLESAVDGTEVIVVRAPSQDVDLRCGGHPMHAKGGAAPGGVAPDPGHGNGTQIGKRYADEATGLELLCTKGGEASLSLGDEPLLLKGAKPLPSSD